MNKLTLVCIVVSLGVSEFVHTQPAKISSALKIARLKYSGGGDWYNDQSAEVNLLRFVRENTNIHVEPTYEFVDLNSEQLFTYPMLFMTGHGNISFNEQEVRRLRTYLENGGFLYADDDYGMDKAFRREMKKIFPGQELVELPFSHDIYRNQFEFPGGPPKTHEHDGKPAQGFGLFHNGRLVVYYTFESNPSDGWADPEVHNNTPQKREEALRFGTNIIVWALTN
ncbi:MAG: DUF4159 domain-containing protein [Bacteroidetes bacterium]|nr:DUF4159 domain-containing protein [Bacteroidota bacterium]MCW5895807.1 DUF4159 domain-containing protein [Bacteroidota bacterium]